MKKTRRPIQSRSIPHAPHRERRIRIVQVLLILGVLILCGILLWRYLALKQERYHVQEITVSGLRALDESMIRAHVDAYLDTRLVFGVPRRAFILISTRSFEESLMEAFPRIQTVAVDKHFRTKRLSIDIHEYEAALIWCVGPRLGRSLEEYGRSCSYATPEGYTFERAPYFYTSRLLRIFDARNEEYEVVLESFMLTQETLQEIMSYRNSLTAFGYTQEDVELLPRQARVYVTTSFQGTSLSSSFELRVPEAMPIDEVMTLLQELRTLPDFRTPLENGERLEYIDLRFEGKIFFRFMS